MQRRAKTPQEKKTLSLKKDRRNAYGEHDKGSRKSIPLRKALDNRKVRHRTRQAVAVIDRLDEGAAALVESSARHDVHRVGGWRKAPDQPLGDLVRWTLGKRVVNVGAKLRRAEKQGRIPDRLKAAPETAP